MTASRHKRALTMLSGAHNISMVCYINKSQGAAVFDPLQSFSCYFHNHR